MSQILKVGDRVKFLGAASYKNLDGSADYPNSGNGTIIYIRHRYKGESYEYEQYQFHFHLLQLRSY